MGEQRPNTTRNSPTIFNNEQNIPAMSYTRKTSKTARDTGSTVLFVDYDDLHRSLTRLTHNENASVKVISEMIDALRNNVPEEEGPIAETRAYGDFASLHRAGDQAKNMLYMKGIETRYAPNANRDSTIELQIGIDAMELLHNRADVARLVLLSGQRMYLPLVQVFRKYERDILVASLADPASPEHGFSGGSDWFLSARELLSASAREFLNAPFPTTASRAKISPVQRRPRVAPAPAERRPRTAPLAPAASLEEIDDPILVRTLEIIDDHFGQYDEVYLTPLLRKLSDLVDERRYDPKNLISDLEEQQAVRLEKRSGFPHDYTVLILDEQHPTVARILSGRERSADFQDPASTSSSWYYGEDDTSEDTENGIRMNVDKDEESGEYEGDTFDYDEYDRDIGASA